MAVYEFGVTVERIRSEFPSAEPDPFGSSGSHGVTVDHVAEWITSSSGQISALIISKRGASYDVSSLDENDLEAVRDAVVSRVVAKALLKLRKVELAREYMATWDAVLDLWRNRTAETVEGGPLPVTGTTSDAPALHWGRDHDW